MDDSDARGLGGVLASGYEQILHGWIEAQAAEGVKRTDLVSPAETEQQSRDLLSALARAAEEAETGSDFDFSNPVWDNVRSTISAIGDSRIERGVSVTEMAWFISSLKQSVFEELKTVRKTSLDRLVEDVWYVSRVIDQLALHAIDVFVARREEVIERQRLEMSEVSAPVVKLWERIVTVPLIGTLDSYRSQTVMENLLDAIVEREAEVAIIDITGVSTVDTMVAQHLLKTAAAVRLMGAECVICGVSPKIAQTVVHLGVDLPNVTTRVDLQSGLAYAFEKIGLRVRAD